MNDNARAMVELLYGGPFGTNPPVAILFPDALFALLESEEPVSVLHVVMVAEELRKTLWPRPISHAELAHVLRWRRKNPAELDTLEAQAFSSGLLVEEAGKLRVTTPGYDFIAARGKIP